MTTDGPVTDKFYVRRNDDSPNHPNCRYWVLDVDHDPAAIPAMVAYARAIEGTHPQLAEDMRLTYGLPTNA